MDHRTGRNACRKWCWWQTQLLKEQSALQFVPVLGFGLCSALFGIRQLRMCSMCRHKIRPMPPLSPNANLHNETQLRTSSTEEVKEVGIICSNRCDVNITPCGCHRQQVSKWFPLFVLVEQAFGRWQRSPREDGTPRQLFENGQEASSRPKF